MIRKYSSAEFIQFHFDLSRLQSYTKDLIQQQRFRCSKDGILLIEVIPISKGSATEMVTPVMNFFDMSFKLEEEVELHNPECLEKRNYI